MADPRTPLPPAPPPPVPPQTGVSLEAGPPPVPIEAAPPQPQASLALPPHRGKLERIQDHVNGAIENLRAWVELRIALLQREVELKLKETEEKAKFGAIMGVLAAVGALFLLLTLGFALASLFELLGVTQLPALALGYLVVTLLLFGAAGVAYLRSPFRKS
jgi:hypothetical protein